MYRTLDHYSRQAKKQGYAARSVYKLQEIQQKWGLIRRGSRVIELGAAPGSWSKYVLQQLGEQGRLMAVDQQPISIEDRRLTFSQQDMLDRNWQQQLALAPPFDLLLSDAAPATSGHRLLDAARSTELVHAAVELAQTVVQTGGHLVVKMFDNEETPRLRDRIREQYRHCHSLRPQAVRRCSREIYLVGRDKRAPDSSA